MNVQIINQTYKTLESLGIQVYLVCVFQLNRSALIDLFSACANV